MTKAAAIFLIIAIIIEGCLCAGPSYLNAEVPVIARNRYGQFFVVSRPGDGPSDIWGWYQGGIPPHLWCTLKNAKDCAGRKQSPINIQTNDVIRTTRIPPFDFSDLRNTNGVKMCLLNSGRRAQVDFNRRKPTIQGGGLAGTFQLTTLHLHWGKYNRRGSEHKINGKQSAMELHFEFTPVGARSAYRQGAAVMGVLIRVGKYNKKYAKLINHLRKIPDVGKRTYLPTFPIIDLFPDNTCCYYRYKGSLTTPPCSETILWTVFKDVVYISQKQINQFRRLKGKHHIFTKPGRRIVDTYRPCQQVNGRKVKLNCEVKKKIANVSESKKRVCIIGAGPCGLSNLYHFAAMDNSPEVVCYEKGSNWLGMWNVTWMTGTDEFGEPCHGGQYKNLWINGPKECQEFPNYTFDDHIGKAVASFPPQPVIRDYLEGRFTKTAKKDLKQFIKWNTVVRQVRYNKDTDNFTVTTEDLKARHTSDDTFTHVIVATGIFNVPNKPAYPGIETFNGRVIHSHDFRDATEYKGQRLLLIGGSYSAEDIALQTMKYGAKSVVTSYRTKPMNYKFPDGVMERPLVTKIENNTIYFKDGGDPVEVDVIILCTGYLYHFPYLDDDLRLYSSVSLYPAGLYKGTVWLKGGNNKLLYMGTQNQYYSFPMFDAQALWACRYIAGTLPNELRSMEEMSQDEQKWIKRCESLKGHHEEIDFQTEFLADLCKPTEYNEKVLEIRELWHKWIHDKDNNIVTYRDQRFTSVFTGTQAANRKPWYEDFDGSIKAFTSTEA